MIDGFCIIVAPNLGEGQPIFSCAAILCGDHRKQRQKLEAPSSLLRNSVDKKASNKGELHRFDFI